MLKKYSCLWGMHRPITERPRLIVVNLMWTPKDEVAVLKINGQTHFQSILPRFSPAFSHSVEVLLFLFLFTGKCDDVMRLVMSQLRLTPQPYSRYQPYIFREPFPFSIYM